MAAKTATASHQEWFHFVAELRRLLASCRTPSQREELLAELPEEVIRKLRYEWRYWARPKQLEPIYSTASTHLILAGRGYGKGWCASNWVIENVRFRGYRHVALVGETSGDVRDVMVEGPSGILACSPPDFKPTYEPSKRRLTWPNGAVATTFSGDKPDQLRGPNRDLAWVDELAKFRYDQETWDQLAFTLRLGEDPRVLVTTTPRPTRLIKELVNDPTVAVTRGSTYENKHNLAASFLANLERRYAGTRIGRQEIDAELLEDVEGALWTLRQIEELRVREAPPLKRIVVALDPSGTSTGDECGIVVAGLGYDDVGYVLEDYSLHASPNQWAQVAVTAFEKHEADRIVAETNFGADLVESVLRSVDPKIPFKKLTASRGKAIRAEGVVALYEQARIKHVGAFAELETEMTQWTPGDASPNRMDALVWAFHELMLGKPKPQSSGGAWLI